MSGLVCIRCGCNSVVLGHMIGRTDGYGRSSLLVPEGLKWFRFSVGVRVASEFRACSECGLVWSETDVTKFKGFLSRYLKRL
jgi:hypothetical protein